MPVVRVLLINESRLLTAALVARIDDEDDLLVVGGHTPDDPHLSATIARARPDVVVLDAAAARTVRAAVDRPGTVVVLLSSSNDTAGAIAAARSGAAAWLAGPAGSHDVIEAIRGAASGRAYYPPEHLGPILRELRRDALQARRPLGPLDTLTVREREVLRDLVEGLSNAEIAARSQVSPHTVRTHLQNLFRKLGVRSRLEAVRVARRHGLLPEHAVAESHAESPRDLVHPSYDNSY